MSLGPAPAGSAVRQRVAKTRSAVESGPPETARMITGADLRSANSVSASAIERAATSAADTLLFPVDGLLHARRRTWIFAQDLAEGSTSGLPFTERPQRLPKTQKRVRRPGGGFMLG